MQTGLNNPFRNRILNRHQRILKAVEDNARACLKYCMYRPGDVDVSGPIVGVLNGIDAHDDSHLGPEATWTAFYVIHNDGCRVWGKDVALTPKEGDIFVMNIHKRHGLYAHRKTNQVFLAVHHDGRTKREALAGLRKMLSELSS